MDKGFWRMYWLIAFPISMVLWTGGFFLGRWLWSIVNA